MHAIRSGVALAFDEKQRCRRPLLVVVQLESVRLVERLSHPHDSGAAPTEEERPLVGTALRPSSRDLRADRR
jgi:hypothetical protein